MYKFVISDNTLVIIVGDEAKIFQNTDPKYKALAAACIGNDWAEVDKVLDVGLKKAIEYIGFSVKDDLVYIDDECLPLYLGKRIKSIADEGGNVSIVLNFWHKLKTNPSYHSRHQLFQFLESNHCPLTPDGNFIGYKAITNEFKDKHTNKIDNSIGSEPTMLRRDVDDDYSAECSYGFHIGSYQYATSFASNNDRLVECEVDPSDVVSVAQESGFHKLRVCKYKVIKEIERCGQEPDDEIYDYEDYGDYQEDDYE